MLCGTKTNPGAQAAVASRSADVEDGKLWRIGPPGTLAHFLFLQLVFNAPELLQRGLQALHNLPRQNCRIGQVVGVLQAPVLEPEDVQAGFIPFHQILIGKGPEALYLQAVVAVLRIVAFDEVLQVLQLERIGLEGEVLVGPQVVNYSMYILPANEA